MLIIIELLSSEKAGKGTDKCDRKNERGRGREKTKDKRKKTKGKRQKGKDKRKKTKDKRKKTKDNPPAGGWGCVRRLADENEIKLSKI
ncbi:MAG: hypothetical protein IPH88_12020 [Bacteroidales bacterium]|nr:hypothetical protein [Bacteroidales bacterium]